VDLAKPRGNRRKIGTVSDWLEKLGMTVAIADLPTDQQLRLGNIEIHTAHLGQTGGYAVLHNDVIEVHEGLLLEGRTIELKYVVLHELGHFLDFIRRGTSDHSKHWRKAMMDLGEPNPTKYPDLSFLSQVTPHGYTKLRCDAVRDGHQCSHTVNTAKPEKYAGVLKCTWCFSGRMQVV
jgi:predicted SprT family Zn-dependent metalloprotease